MIHLVDLHGKGGVPDGVQYIGRAGRGGKPPRSPLSNPYSVEQHGDEALRRFRVYLVNALVSADPAIILELGRLEKLASDGDLHLGCWCVERPAYIEGLALPDPGQRCHGDIVATVLTHWGVRLATFARARFDGDTSGPQRWSAWLARDYGHGPGVFAVMASVFGMAEVRAMAAVAAEIENGMPAWAMR